MGDDFVASKEFVSLMQRHVRECFELILSKNESFDVLVNMNFVRFNPPLPEHLKLTNEVALFALSGYGLSSAKLINESLIFETSFGEENFCSSVSIDFSGVLRISIDKTTLLVNLSLPPAKTSHEVQKSADIFKSNPKNKEIFK